MKVFFRALIAAAVFASLPAFAHHPAADIVDEDIYEMIDSMVADTPHADLEFSDMGGGAIETLVTARTLPVLENMIDDGLLEYAAMLDGDVEVGIDFNDNGSVSMTILQQ